MPELPPIEEEPVSVSYDNDEVVAVDWTPARQAEKKNRLRSAIDQMLRGTKQVTEESIHMAAQLPSVGEAVDAVSAIPRGIANSDLGEAFGPALDVAKRGLSVFGAPFHYLLGGAHAVGIEPQMAALGASDEDIQKSRSHFETIGSFSAPEYAAIRAAAPEARIASELASAGKRAPVVDPTTGKTILKNPPADEALQAEYLNELRKKGVDVNDPRAVAAHVAEREGVPSSVSVDTEMPISKTDEAGNVQIEPGTPGEVATRIEHEVGNHVPQKLGLREAPVEDNDLLTLEGLEKERATFAAPVEPGRGLPGPHLPSDVNPALEALVEGRVGADDLSRRADMVMEQRERIAGQGTIAKETREPYREAGAKPETYSLRASEEDVVNYGKKLVKSARALKEAYRNPNLQDPTSQLGIRMAMDALEEATDKWTALRFSFGRGTGRFGKALDEALAGASRKEAREIARLLEEAGVNLEGSQLARQAYWTEGWKSLLAGDAYKGITDLTKFGSMNLFSVLSFSMDAVTSAWRHAGMLGESAARDAYWAGKGHFNFPNLGAYWRSIKRGELPESIQRELGGAIAGEGAPGSGAWGEIWNQGREAYKEGGLKGLLRTDFDIGPGVATNRENIGSFVFDELTMRPAYAKRVMDSVSGRAAARVKLSALADEAANAQGLKGQARADFIDDFISAPSKETTAEVLRQGHELQWNVPVSKFEQEMNKAAYVRWFVTAFPSWPSQFVRGMADMLGVRPATWQRMLKSGAKGPEIAGMIGKAATGWGSVALVNSLYDHIDFDSMELVVPGGERLPGGGRYRLSGLSPVPEILGLLAALKGDGMKWFAAVKHMNLPIVSAIGRAGGMFQPLVNNLSTLTTRGTYNAAKVQRELTDMVNSFFPAQAVLGALKSALDPVSREGIGASLPVVSEKLPAKIDVTTGEEQVPQQKIGAARFRSIIGAPIRGAERYTSEVYELLDYYAPEAIIRSGVRTPFAGLAIRDIPEEWQNEYKEIFGKNRWELLTTKRHGALAGMFMAGKLPLEKGSKGYEKVRRKIMHLDSIAAKRALREMKKRHGKGKVIRKPSILESSGAGWDYAPKELEPMNLEEEPVSVTYDEPTEEPQTAPQ